MVLALLFVGGATLAGPSALHIDLVPPGGPANAPSGGNAAQAVNTPAIAISSPSTTNPASGQGKSVHISSLDAIPREGGSDLALLLFPILAGIASATLLYAAAARRLDAE